MSIQSSSSSYQPSALPTSQIPPLPSLPETSLGSLEDFESTPEVEAEMMRIINAVEDEMYESGIEDDYRDLIRNQTLPTETPRDIYGNSMFFNASETSPSTTTSTNILEEE